MWKGEAGRRAYMGEDSIEVENLKKEIKRLRWFEDICTRINYCRIASNNEGIRDAVEQIGNKLHVIEGE